MADPLQQPARPAQPAWVRLCQWLWNQRGFLWGTVIFGIVLNLFASWLITPWGNIFSQTPLGSLLGHPLPFVLGGVSLLGLTGGLWLINRFHPALVSQRVPQRPLTRAEQQALIHLLSQDYDRRLAQSLQGAALMMLGLQERADMIRSSAQLVFHRTPIAPASALPSGTSIVQAYDDAGQGLLILGTPGAGKTTLLLNLAHELLIRTQSDSHHPIAVILNLSSWATKKPPLEAWIIDQLRLVYGIPPRLSRVLLEQDQWLLLLDGLDEVGASARSQCIEAINAYREEHFVPLVVCSRSDEYVAQEARLALSNAVEARPLQEQEVMEYLKQVGKPMAAVRAALRNNTVLKELLTTPLMLNVVILAYRDKSTKDLPKLGPAQDQQHQIFARYVERMLEQRTSRRNSAPQHTRQWLIWLAQQLQQRHLTEFYLEELQLAWLLTERSRILVDALFGLFVGLLVGIPAGLAVSPSNGLLAKLFVGLIVGLAAGWLIFEAKVTRERKKRAEKIIEWSWKKGGLAGVVSGLLAGLYFGLRWRPESGLLAGLLSGLLAGLIGGLFFGLSSQGISEGIPIHPLQGIRSDGWAGLRFGLSCGTFCGLLFGVIVLGVGGLSLGLTQGLLLWLGSVLVGGMLGGLVGVLLLGSIYLEHYFLRFLLWRIGAMPWRYVHFLEEASERILLQRVGGGYCFIHPLLQDYFASLGAGVSANFLSYPLSPRF